jgi:hypothetical protein
VDGGANGSCVFNYSDGWWKSGDEFAHNDAAEEWFGLVEYMDPSDKHGQIRPVWNAVRDYQSAIITEPRSSEIYSGKVPLEVFFNDTIKKIEVLLENNQVYLKQIENTYLSDTINIDFQDIKDATLVFNCYDEQNYLVKTEEKNILLTANPLTLPNIQISTNADLWQTGSVEVSYHVQKSIDFTIDTKIDYIYYPHVGFEYGQKFRSTLPAGDPFTLSKTHKINSNVNVITLGAAFNISYNGFQKRIYNQITITRPDGSPNSSRDQIYHGPGISIFPNPVTESFKILPDAGATTDGFDYCISDFTGRVLMQGVRTNWNSAIDITWLKPGVYGICIRYDHQLYTLNKIIIKV